MNLIKKLFVYTVVFSMVFGFTGLLGTVNVAKADDLVAGTLVKRPDMSSVYYLYDDEGTLKRMTFPNSATYFTWFEDFDDVVTITADELGDIPLGSNAVYRPGTRLIKITTDPKVYAAEEGGVLRWIDSEETALALYGEDWASWIDDVPDAFFAGNYNSDDAVDNLVTATAHPVGTLIRYADTDEIYYIDASVEKRLVTEDGFTANKFSEEYVVENIPDTITYTPGTSITEAEAGLFPITEIVVVPPVTTGDLSVALASDNPASKTILVHSTGNTYPEALIPFLKLKFTASNDGDVDVTELKFKRLGVAKDADLGSLYLYDGTTKLAEYNAFSDKVLRFTNSSGLFTVEAGTNKVVTLKGDLARASTPVSASKTIGFEVVDASYVSADAGSISASYPMSGNLMTTAQVDDLGTVYFTSYTSFPATIKADAANQELWRFSIVGGNQILELRYVKLTMVGTIATDDIANLRLEIGGVQLGETAVMNSSNELIFDFTDDPLEIPAGQTKIIQLRGDMAGGAGRVFKFTVQRATDVVVWDTNYEVYLSTAKDAVTTAFGVIQPETGDGTDVDSGTVTVGLNPDSPINYIADGGTNLTFAIFDFKAAGEDVKVESLKIKCYSNDATNYLDNVKLLYNGSQVGTTDTTILCDNGTDTTTYTLGSTVVLPAGETQQISVVADTNDTTIAGDETLRIELVATASSNAVGQTTLTAITTTAQAGRTLTVKSGTVTATENLGFGDKSATFPTGVANQGDVQIASFFVTAGSGEAVDMTQIQLKDQATYFLGDNFQNLYLKHGETPRDMFRFINTI